MQRLLLFGFMLFFLGACASVQPDPILLEYEGVYQEAGTDDPLYCYCDNPGYLNACGNVLIPLCLEKNSALANCTNVLIKGYFQYFQPNLPARAECPDTEEEMRLLIVTEWTCRD